MSRKWERMVEKNRMKVNRQRRKSGQAEIGGTGGQDMQVFKGRSWILPMFLVGFSIFYFIGFYHSLPHDGVFWFTGFSYMGLGVLIFLVRRPVIRIGKNVIWARRFNGDRSVEAQDIEEIVVSPSYIALQLKQQKKRWLYTKFQHRFAMDELAAKLKAFAQANKVALREEGK